MAELLQVTQIIAEPTAKDIRILQSTGNAFEVSYTKNGKTARKWFDKEELYFDKATTYLNTHNARQDFIEKTNTLYNTNKALEIAREEDIEVFNERVKRWKQFTTENDYTIYADGKKVPSKHYASIKMREESINANSDYVFSKSNYIITSQHSDCSPLCQPYQAKIMYLNKVEYMKDLELAKELEYKDVVKILEDAISYEDACTGDDVGWFEHYGCRHSKSPFDPFVNTPPKEKYTKEEVSENYANRQSEKANANRRRKQREAMKAEKEGDIY